MTWRLLTSFCAAATLTAAVALAPATAGASGTSASASTRALTPLEFGILQRVNTIRRDHRLAPLRVNVRLASAADKHSRDMVANGFFEHDSAAGTFGQRLERFYGAASSGTWSAGENILWRPGALEAKAAVESWMASPPHRANILCGRWREIGISAVTRTAAPGVYGGADVTVVTTDFGYRR